MACLLFLRILNSFLVLIKQDNHSNILKTIIDVQLCLSISDLIDIMPSQKDLFRVFAQQKDFSEAKRVFERQFNFAIEKNCFKSQQSYWKQLLKTHNRKINQTDIAETYGSDTKTLEGNDVTQTEIDENMDPSYEPPPSLPFQSYIAQEQNQSNASQAKRSRQLSPSAASSASH